MSSHWMIRMTLVLVSVLLAAKVTGGTMTAEELTRQTGIAGGLCSFPCAAPGDETLAFELAKRPSFVVHILSPDAALVKRMRARAEAEGLLGRSFYVEAGGPIPLPFADRMVDVLVANNLSVADLTPELRTEWLRVLAPRRGAAFVGCAKGTGGGLSTDTLKTWIKDLPMAKTIANDAGAWAILKTDLPAGSDPWSHRCHGPDNAQVSADTTLQAPFLTQWWGMPRQESFWGMTVVSGNGRMFSIRASRNANESVFLTARALNNGIVLWQKMLRQAAEKDNVPHGGFVPDRSCVAVVGDTLCLVERDGILRLDGETGNVLDRIPGPKPGGQVKWLATLDGMLAVLAGDADVVKPIAFQTVAANPVGRELAVYDVASKQELWHETTAGDIDQRMIAARGKFLYCVVQDAGVVCRELATGKTVWTNSDPDVKSEFRTLDAKAIEGFLFSQPALLALDDVLLLRAQWAKDLISLSREDGRVLWKKSSAATGGKCGKSFQRSLTGVPLGKAWVYGGGDGALDLTTGEPVKGLRLPVSGCGPTLSTPKYLITAWGKVMIVGSRYLRAEDVKAPCDIGSVVSEGLLVSMPSECGCAFEVKGYRALASAGSIRPHTAPPWKERLRMLDTAEPAALALTDADWPTYRHDPQHSGATAASVGGAPKVLWHWKPANAVPGSDVPRAAGPRLAPDFLATAPVAAGGFVWFASHDGVIRCVKADSGKEVWTFATGGMLFAPPTIWEGRLLAGGGDGRISCLDASTGRLLWQFLAAPHDRRLFWFGHLVSTWPVVSGVLVQDGVAYAAAGYHKENGIHAYALNPRNGEVLWEKDDAGAQAWSGLGSLGHGALGGGRLWLASAPAGSFELKTGDWKSLDGMQFGCEMGVMDKWVLQGGRRLSETQDTLPSPLGGSGFVASSTELHAAQFKVSDTGTILPVWDAELAVMPPSGLSGPLTALPLAKLLPWLSGKFPGLDSAAQPRPKFAGVKAFDWTELKSWATPAMLPAGVALAKDRLLVACVAGRKSRLVAFRRDDGAEDWSAELPDQPAMNRLAVDRDGRILVALCDGSMLCLGK